MPVLPGAEPYRHDGGPVGVVLCHGFTGTPQSLRAWAQALAADGHSVRLPLLPGHGTRWQDMNTTRWPDWFGAVDAAWSELAERCDAVVVAGLSMGGALALRLAQVHPQTRGVVLVNPSVLGTDPMMRLLPLVRHLLPAVKGVGNDVKKPGSVELAYDRSPLHAAWSLTQLWRTVQADLPKVTQPLLLMRSEVDHVVPAASSARVLEGVRSADRTEIVLHDSFHVATLDNDAPRIIEESGAFIARVTKPGGTP